jgi:hypothetical protein
MCQLKKGTNRRYMDGAKKSPSIQGIVSEGKQEGSIEWKWQTHKGLGHESVNSHHTVVVIESTSEFSSKQINRTIKPGFLSKLRGFGMFRLLIQSKTFLEYCHQSQSMMMMIVQPETRMQSNFASSG